jgi:hypothetical protein
MSIEHVRGLTQVSLLPSFAQTMQDRVTYGQAVDTLTLRQLYSIGGTLVHASRVMGFSLEKILYQTLAAMSRWGKGAGRGTQTFWARQVPISGTLKGEWGGFLAHLHMYPTRALARSPLGEGLGLIHAISDAGPKRWGLVYYSLGMGVLATWNDLPISILAQGQVHREAHGIREAIQTLRLQFLDIWPRPKRVSLRFATDCWPVFRALIKGYSPSFALNQVVVEVLDWIREWGWHVEWWWVPGHANVADPPSRCSLPPPPYPVPVAALCDFLSISLEGIEKLTAGWEEQGLRAWNEH